MTPPDVVLKTVAVHAAGTTRYLPLDPIPLGPGGEIALGLRVDCGMDDAGEREQLHLHLSLRIGGTNRPPRAPTVPHPPINRKEPRTHGDPPSQDTS